MLVKSLFYKPNQIIKTILENYNMKMLWALKAVIFLILFTIFFFAYFLNVAKQYKKEFSNYAQYKEKLTNRGTSFPALTLCIDPYLKPSRK